MASYQYILVIYILCLLCSTCRSMKILHSFRDPSGNELQKFTVSTQTGHVFLGTVNKLHKLTSHLSVDQSVSTGPKMDNVNCPPPLLACSEPKSPLDSQVKGFLLDSDSKSLILCSSLFHGSCQFIDTKNISHTLKFFHKPLVPNDHHSCVLLIAPSLNNTQALYIATTYSDYGNAAYRRLVPSISSRNLDDLNYIYRDSKGATKLSVQKQYRKSFIVKQIYGFSNGEFVYFITVQRQKPGSDQIVSRISRLCQKDKYFRSFVELPLKCDGSNIVFSSVESAYFDGVELFAIFSETSASLGSIRTSVCKFQIQDIDRMFDEAVTDCYNGIGMIGPEHYTEQKPCPKLTTGVDMCHGSNNISSIEGDKPISSIPLYIFNNKRPTVIISQKEGVYNYIYIGTLTGQLIKLMITNNKAIIIDHMVVNIGDTGPQMIEKGLKSDQLYVLSSHKLSLISTRHCDSLTSCEACLTTGHTTCGWCIMENRCTSKHLCEESNITPHWISKTHQTCASISTLQPPLLSYKALQNGQIDHEIKFQLNKLRFKSHNELDLQCLFINGHKEHGTKATINTNNYITCPLPLHSHLPTIPQDHEDIELQFHVGGKMIVKRDLSIFDCQGNKNCTGCSNSKFNCQWCYNNNICTEQSDTCPQGIQGISKPDNCPRLETPESDTDILVHSGEQKTISIKVKALQADQRNSLKCHFDVAGDMKSVSAKIDSSTLTCDTVQLSYKSDIPYILAGFKVTWGSSEYPLDNPQGMNVRIYKCASMVTNCGKCLSLDVGYDCGWCQDQCTLQKKCSKSWLSQSETCPNPQILRFSPSTGPVEGVTELEINGLNLGKSLSDVLGHVTVAGVECDVNPDHYEPSSGFKCKTKAISMTKSGIIKVKVDNKYTAESDTLFEFVDPKLDTLIPNKGFVSGGTNVIITGEYLDTGSHSHVIVGGITVPVIRSNMTALEFKTPEKGGDQNEVNVEVDFGGYRKKVKKMFTYIKDPTITMIEPKRSILSGGTTITVVGTDLNLIQEPKFFTTYGGVIYTSACSKENELMLSCIVPGIKTADEVTEVNPLEVHYGFDMDQVQSLRNISHQSAFGPMLYYPDPDVYKFTGDDATQMYNHEDLLSIKGTFRSVNPLLSNVIVYVGDEECENTISTDTAITCQPPNKPLGLDDSGRAVVELQIGNMKSDVGYLQYYQVPDGEKPIALGIVLGVVLPIMAIVALLTFCVIRKHRKHAPSDSYIPDVLKDYEGAKEDEEIGLNHVSVKADMNGLTEDKDSGPYITELLGKFDDPILRQNITSLLVPRSKLDIGELIGKGNFGAVYKAQYQTEEKQVQVAVKTLQGKTCEAETIQNFLQDAVILKDLQHINILSVVGVCITVSDDPIIIMPFMATEDLKSYIREPSKNLTVLDLLDFAHQIVNGMVYLESVKVVHQNLAARNCIVSEEKKIQITDCGLTKSLFNQEYINNESGCNVLKWMAPESIDTYIFTHKSDVWSYGIVLWELMTRGVTPYPDVVISDLPQYLKDGKRMKKPKQCTEQIYEIMLKCWNKSSEDRPSFIEIEQELSKQLDTDTSISDDETSQLLKNSVDIGGSTEYLEVIG